MRKEKIASALVKQSSLVVSVQVINEVCYNLKKKVQLSESDIAALVDGFYNDVTVIAPDQQQLGVASALRSNYSLSFWDSLIVAAALSANATTLYSEDMHNGLLVEGRLTITNPFV